MAEKTVPVKSGGQKTKAPRRGINHPVTYAFTVVILVIIVVAFVFVSPVGGGMFDGGGDRIIFGSYKGKPIEYIPGGFLAQQIEQGTENLRAEGAQPESDTALEERLHQICGEAFALTAFRTGVLSIMQESGAGVSDQRVDEVLVGYPGFMEDGEFSEKRYNQVSSAERLVIRDDARSNILYYTYLQDAVNIRVSKKETEFFKSLGSPERNLRYVSFRFDDYPESQVADYGRQNAEKFSQAKLSVITVVSSRSDADKIREQAAAGTAFSELAVAQSKDTFAKSGGDMGWRYFYELAGFGRSDEDIRGIFSLAPGDISRVIEGPAGADGQLQSYSIFRCDETVRIPDFTKPDTVTAVRLYMNTFERGQIQDYLTEQAAAFKTKAEGSSFTSAALSDAKAVKETGFFPVNYGDTLFLKRAMQNEANAELASASYSDTFFAAAFSLKENTVSEPVILQDSILVMQLLEERPQAPEESTVLDYYLSSFLGRHREESLQTFILNPENLRQDNFETAFHQLYNFPH